MFQPGVTEAMAGQRRAALMAESDSSRSVAAARWRRRSDPARIAAAHGQSRESGAGVPWFRQVGASGAVRIGQVVEVGATGAFGPQGQVLFPGDPYKQTSAVLTSLGETLAGLGADLCDVVRTRVYLKKAWQWEAVGKAHGDFFEGIRPVTTFVGAGAFVHPDELVEIEATAFLRS